MTTNLPLRSKPKTSCHIITVTQKNCVPALVGFDVNAIFERSRYLKGDPLLQNYRLVTPTFNKQFMNIRCSPNRKVIMHFCVNWNGRRRTIGRAQSGNAARFFRYFQTTIRNEAFESICNLLFKLF